MIDKILFSVIFIIVSLSFSYRRYAIGRRDAYLLRAGLVCTLSADFCMLVIYNNVIGLLFFICAQTIYFYRYLSGRPRAVVLIPCLLGVFTALTYFTRLTFETRLAAVYACALITGTSAAFIRRKAYPKPNRVMIPLGMLLFTLCDINVGLINVLPDGAGKTAAHVLIWVFYLPSQILLSASGAKLTY